MFRLQMRTMLLICLLALSFGLTAMSLLAIRRSVSVQIDRDLASDLDHSVQTFLNVQRQQRQMIARESALLADLPSLKALMTTEDAATIQDGAAEFWTVSGSDLFSLANVQGKVVARYTRGGAKDAAAFQAMAEQTIAHPMHARIASLGDSLFEVIAQPLRFGPNASGSMLGYLVIGYAIDAQVAREVSEASAAEVAFASGGHVLVSTLSGPVQANLESDIGRLPRGPGRNANVRLGREQYLATAVALSEPLAPDNETPVSLVVLKSFDKASQSLRTVNRWVLGLGALALVLAGLLAVSISRAVTGPLEALVRGARALGRGNFDYELSDGGTAEIGELRHAFDRMRVEIKRSQRELVDSERLATIGRMASSISHDLRHHLSAMYANAEFLSLESTPQSEREELILEVQAAVHGMTDLLDSLVLFSRTGSSLNLRPESINLLLERAVSLLRAHPDARGVEVELRDAVPVEAHIDGQKFGRAVFNLVLNACQAARKGAQTPQVLLTLAEDEETISIRVEDNGRGVPASIRGTLFQPFVSHGKESGIGLGLTLAQHIAQEHGGTVELEESSGSTVFVLVLRKEALRAVSQRTGSQEIQPVLSS